MQLNSVPILPRFVTPDSIIPDPFNPQSLNRYAYCLNNPLRYTDPTGYIYQDENGEWWLDEITVTADQSSVFAYSTFDTLYQDWFMPAYSMLGGMFTANNAYAGVTGINGSDNQAGNNNNNTGNYNAQAAVDFLKNNYNGKESTHWCARAIRKALNAGGIATPNPKKREYAKQYGDYLPTIGFKSVNLKGYKPQIGDVAWFPAIVSNKDGHVEMYDGTGWRSDYVQPAGPNDSIYGPGFFANQNWVGTSFAIFRYKEEE